MRAVDPAGGTLFDSPYAHGFVRIAAAVPRVRVGDPRFNGARTVELARRAHEDHAALVIFPELGLAAYSSEDLFHQEALRDAVAGALHEVVRASEGLMPVIVVGAPVPAEGGLFNAAVVIHRGPHPRARCPRATSPSTTSTTRSASSARRGTSRATRCACSVRPCPSPRTSCSRAVTCPTSSSASRSARTCGRRSPRARTRRSPAPPCWPTSRPPTSRSARTATGECCAKPSQGAPSPGTSTPQRGWASRPRTWRGTDRP